MKIIVKSGVVKVENCHDVIARSFLRYLSQKKKLFQFNDADNSITEFGSDITATYNSIVHKVKDIKPLVFSLKVDWLKSEWKQNTGFSTSGLKERGWTDGAINRFLGEPDAKVKNPYYKSSAPMRIYHVDRVLKQEGSEEWTNWYENTINKRLKQSFNRSQYVREARLSLIKQAHSYKIAFPNYTPGRLKKEAINHYNHYWEGEKFAHKDSDSDFTDRLSVNFLRHHHTDYDEYLARMCGEIGNKDFYREFKRRILLLISQQFPHLKRECQKQTDALATPNPTQ